MSHLYPLSFILLSLSLSFSPIFALHVATTAVVPRTASLPYSCHLSTALHRESTRDHREYTEASKRKEKKNRGRGPTQNGRLVRCVPPSPQGMDNGLD